MGNGTTSPLIFSIRSEDGEESYLTAFHKPGVTPIIPRIGEHVWVSPDQYVDDGPKECFVVRRVEYWMRNHQCWWSDGQIHPGTWGPRPGELIAAGVTEVTIFVRRDNVEAGT